MWSIFNLLKFEVIVWVKLTSASRRIEAMLYAAAEDNPYQSVESNDAKDYHWGFDSSGEAIKLIEKLKKVAEEPDVVILRFQSRDNSLDSFTVKDSRRAAH